MTPAQQRSFYHPRFRAAAVVHGWKESVRGAALFATKKTSWGGPETDKLYREIWVIATGLAEMDEREICPGDLRHACNLVATKTKRHSAALNNAETNRVVALFDLLKDPDDLDAMVRWEFPEKAARAGWLAQLKKMAPWAYISQISKDRFGVADWEGLPDADLKMLLITVTGRVRAKANRSKCEVDQPF